MDKNVVKENKLLKEFKEKIKDVLKPEHEDIYLKKWLKARCLDVKKAEIMYRESMQFREKMKVDTILEDYTPPEVLQKYLTGGISGFDKEGSPVKIEMYGNLDMKGLMYSCKKLDLEKTKLQQCEETVKIFEEQSKKLGKAVDGLTVIFDMENVSSKMLWRPGLQMYLHLVKVLEDNYPEMMKRMFVVNAPRIFPLLWKVCRPLISDDMKSKIHVLGGNFSCILLKYIDADQLPAYLGGTLQDEDGNGRCPSKICQGGQVPDSYYLTDLINTGNMETATVAKGEKLSLEVKVDIPGSLIRWEFKTEDYDISFGVTFTDSLGKTEDVIPVEKVNSHMVPEDGSLTCDQPGIYIVCFDNSYSWTRGKKLMYLVESHANDNTTQEDVDHITDGGCWTKLVKNMQITHL